MAIRKTTKGTTKTAKEFNLQQINEITAFMDGLFEELNPNFRGWIPLNPRKAKLILAELNNIKENITFLEENISVSLDEGLNKIFRSLENELFAIDSLSSTFRGTATVINAFFTPFVIGLGNLKNCISIISHIK